MSVAHQLLDIIIAGILAGGLAFAVGAVAPELAVTVGVVIASMYYFSRNPWGASDPERINEEIDALYDRML
ncbi:hypothetical protein [Natronomonas sp. EA1]|uniref:hypothetical protein n=1 Tax=Natronomonas sp. EA1 TaxID=3421655 RepID=UPI003EC09F2D